MFSYLNDVSFGFFRSSKYCLCLGMQLNVKLPDLFARQHLDQVSFLVMLCDPVGNEFQVIVRKFDGNAYFTTGWRDMGLFYCLHEGGVVRLVYVRNDKCFIKVKDRFGDEVDYPTPPRIFRLGREPVPNSGFASFLGEQFLRQLARVPTIYYTLYKTLTFNDVHSGKLVCSLHFCCF